VRSGLFKAVYLLAIIAATAGWAWALIYVLAIAI
jgi:hypothetical protein